MGFNGCMGGFFLFLFPSEYSIFTLDDLLNVWFSDGQKYCGYGTYLFTYLSMYFKGRASLAGPGSSLFLRS